MLSIRCREERTFHVHAQRARLTCVYRHFLLRDVEMSDLQSPVVNDRDRRYTTVAPTYLNGADEDGAVPRRATAALRFNTLQPPAHGVFNDILIPPC